MKIKNSIKKLSIAAGLTVALSAVSVPAAVFAEGQHTNETEVTKTAVAESAEIKPLATSNSTKKTVKVTGVKLNKKKATVTVGGSMQLKATVSPSNATNKKVTWTSSNKAVATVDAKGKVTAKKAGTAKITVKTKDGAKKAVCTITVKNKAVIKNGWVKEDGGVKYYKNGKAYTGWHKMGKAEGEKTVHYSYFGSDGVLRTGWQPMGKGTKNPDGNTAKHYCYFGNDGWLRTGWQAMGKGTNNPDGNSAKHFCYFGSDGWLRTGWQAMGKGTKNPDGKSPKHYCFFGDNGWLRTGWQQMGKGTKNPDGNVAKHVSYFGNDGWLRTGWVQFGKGTSNPDGNTPKHYCYFGGNGWLRTGWQDMGKGTKNPDGNSSKHKSYFGNNGWLRTGNHLIGNELYSFGNSGWLMDAFYVGGKRFTGECGIGVYLGGHDYTSYASYYYKNGVKFTGSATELPKEFPSLYYTYDGNGILTRKGSNKVKVTDKKIYGYSFFVNGKPVYEGKVDYSRREIDTYNNSDLPAGVEYIFKIGNDTYKAKTGKNGNIHIDLKDNYKYGTSYTTTISYRGKKATTTNKVTDSYVWFSDLRCKSCQYYVDGKLHWAVAGDEIILEDSWGGKYTRKVPYSSKEYSFTFTTRYTARNYSWYKFTVKDKYGRVRRTYTWNLNW